MSKSQTQAEEVNDEKPKEENLYKTLKESFEIPKLLLDREAQRKQEMKERENVDLKDIELSREEIKELEDHDKLFNDQKNYDRERELEMLDIKELERIQGKLPISMKHEEFRTIKVGPTDLLKNGQMIQVSVSDPFNEEVFHPTDKVVICKIGDSYFALGSFCGFDFTNLATGAFLGEKLICPTCGSTYNINNGFVDQGPSLRGISSFLVQQRDGKLQLIIPEHIPAFSKKQFIKRANIDPRTFVILGDSEAALSAIDALRTNFTGRIVVVPTSPYGSFENTDILHKKFSPISKNESYMVEEDYLDRANIDVIKGDIKAIDLNKNQVIVRGVQQPISFDKILIAWGAQKKRLKQDYSNVYYLEDRHAHARVHNEILKAKTIMVMGGTFEAYQTAASIREYLDSIGYLETQIVLLDSQVSEVQQAFGNQIANEIHQMLKDKRISVLMNTDIKRIEGMNKVESVVFTRDTQKSNERNVEYYIRPDVVIAENGLGTPKFDIRTLLSASPSSEQGEPPLSIGIDAQGVPASNIRFSLHYNDIHSPIFAAGSCTQYPSFVHKTKIRTDDMKYNMEAGFFAAMNMLDKRVEFRYFPFTPMKIGDTSLYFVGERNQAFHEVIINGSVEERKFIAYFIYGNEVIGFVTCGYQNLHLYLWEAMKLLIFPPATQLRNHTIDYKDIVKRVLQLRPQINCKRNDIIKIPSIMRAEFDNELEYQANLKSRLKENIDQENQVQKEKFQKLKQKYDREGVEFIEDEREMEGKKQIHPTMKGGMKPGIQ